MASLQKTYTGDLTASIARRIAALVGSAADTAAEQRALLEGVAATTKTVKDKDGKDVPWGGWEPEDSPFYRSINLPFGMRITDGSIFRQALRHKLTPNPMGLLGSRFEKKPFSPQMLTGQRRSIRSPNWNKSSVGPFQTNAATMARLAGQPFANVGVGAPLKYQRPITRGASYGVTPMVGGGGSTPLQQTRKGPAVEVKDPKLGKFFRAVARSLSASISGMSEKLDSNEESLITAKEGILGTVKKLEYSSDVLETKLDAIIDALRNQNRQQIIAEDNKEAARSAAKTREENRQYEGEVVQKRNEDDLEFMMRDAADEAQDEDPFEPYPTDTGDMWRKDDVTQLARGGIVDGPQSGYPAILHGREAVIPLDTPFTRQNYSAGTLNKPSSLSSIKSRDETSTPSFEKFVPNMFNQIIESKVADVPEMKDTTEMLGKIVEFPVKASGLITFNVLAKALSGMRTLAADVSGPLSTILSNLSAFGIQNSVINSLTRDLSVGGAALGRQEANKAYGQDLKHGNMMSNFMTKVNNLINSPKEGEGGGGYRSGGGYRGGGADYVGGGPGNVIEGAKNWWNRGRNVRVVNENTTRWFGRDGLLADDWKQRGKFGKGGKLGGWDFTRGFRPGVPASEGGMMSGPTPAIRQSIERPLRAIRSLGALKGGFFGLILNELMNPAPVADGTLTGNMDIINSSQFNRTDRSDRLNNFVELRSFENQVSKINNFEAQQSKIIEINNKGVTSIDEPEKPITHIADNPNAIMDVYYPSPYNY